MMRVAAVLLVVLTVLVAACGKGSTTAPSSTTTTTTTTTTDAPVLTNETFSGTLGVGATIFYPFTVSASGTVTEALASIGGSGVPSTVQVRLGIGTMDDTGCNATVSSIVNTVSPQVTASEQPGTYCANVTDVGNLFAAATFTVTITHP
jgi:hypothetical protein